MSETCVNPSKIKTLHPPMWKWSDTTNFIPCGRSVSSRDGTIPMAQSQCLTDKMNTQQKQQGCSVSRGERAHAVGFMRGLLSCHHGCSVQESTVSAPR